MTTKTKRKVRKVAKAVKSASKPKSMKQPFIFVKLLADNSDRFVSRTELAKALGVSEVSVPVYLFYARKQYGLDVEVQKNGRKVVGWKFVRSNLTAKQLTDGHFRRQELVISKTTKKHVVAAATSAKKPAKAVEVVETETELPDAEDLEIHEITDREMDDIRADLGFTATNLLD